MSSTQAATFSYRCTTGWFTRSAILAIPFFACTLADAKPARADVETAVVDDATAIITQLIQDSVATQAVPNAARRIPAACYYFPSTISAIENKRYTGLAKVLRKEFADAAGYAIYEGVFDINGLLSDPANKHPGNLIADALGTLQQQVIPDSFLDRQGADKQALQQLPPGVKAAERTNAGLPIDPKDPATGAKAPQRICYFSNNVDQAQRMADIASRKKDMIKAIAAFSGNPADPKIQALGAALDSYTTVSPTDGTYPAKKAAVVASLAALAPAAPAPVPPALAAVQSSWNALVVTDETPIASQSVATGQMQACAARQASMDQEIACSVAVLVRDAANGDDSLLVADAQRIEAAWLNKLDAKLHLAATDADVASLVTAISKGDSAAAGAAVTKICGGNANCLSVLSFVQPLIARQQVATLEQLLSLTATLATAYGNVDAACKYCSLVSSMATATDGVIKDLQAKDYGAAAGDTMDAVQKMACTPDVKPTDGEEAFLGCDGKDTLVYTFLRSLTVYSVDSLVSGAASSTTADADFRTAAVDLIEEYGGLGVRRSLVRKAQWIYVPEFSLRYAWRPGLVLPASSASTGSQFMPYPSVELVRLRERIPVHNVYLAFHESLIDPLGPFVEVATRSTNINNAGQDPGVVALALIVPRVDFEVGLPDLSKNLVLGIGTAFRAFRVEPTGNGDSRYCTVFQSDANCSTWSAGNVEFSVFAKFVP